MSRILDYVLEPSVVYTNGSFLVKVKVQDDYKYKKLLVSENMKYTTATGTIYTLTNAVSSNNASILQLEGNTTQNGTPTPSSPVEVNTVSGDNEVVVCGKNKLDITNWVKGRINNTSGNIEHASNVSSMTISENTITFTVSQAWNSGIASDFIPVTQGNYTYTYSHNREISMYIDAYNNEKSKTSRLVSYTQSSSPSTKTFTVDSSTKYIRIHFEVNTANVSYEVSNMQLEKGSTATTYEPYTGNSYRVDLGGKNLLKIVKDSTTINGVTFTQNSNGSISVRGTATANASFISTTVQPIEPNRRMKLSGCPSGGSTSTYRLLLRVRSDTTTNIVTVSNTGSGGNDGNVTAYSNAHYILGEIWVYSGQTVDLTFYPQVEYVNLSSDPATEYSPYVANPIELCKIGNYVDKLKRAEGKQLFNYTSQTDDGWYSDIPNFINDTGTYTISINNKSLTGNWAVYFINSSKQRVGDWIKASSSVSTPSTFTVTTEQANAPYIRILPNASGLHDIENYNIMVNEGSTALPYEPYGNNWYIEKNIGKYIFTGAENFIINTTWDTQNTNVVHPAYNMPNWLLGQSGFLSDKFRLLYSK